MQTVNGQALREKQPVERRVRSRTQTAQEGGSAILSLERNRDRIAVVPQKAACRSS
ncbi:MAG TPA: hypothetical protein VLI93_10700 [Acetobacteraceae bacterium]|nr:hypothetical protein [Acetobacteraceae bacterium]